MIEAGSVYAIDGSAFVAFATPSQPYDYPADLGPPGLEFLQGRQLDSFSIALGGQAQLLVPPLPGGKIPLANAHVFYAYPDYVELGGYFECKFFSQLSLKGNVGGFVAFNRNTFNIEGSVEGCIDLRGSGGPPAVVLTGPGGVRVETPASGEGTAGRDFFAFRFEEDDTTEIVLRKPARGKYTVATQAGSPAITSLAVADGLAEPRVKARVAGRGRERVLRYRISPVDPGQKVTFAERGARTYRVLGQARGASGSLRFTPGPGRRGRRTIVALVERGGAPAKTLSVARFSAPADAKPARPRRLRVARRGTSLVVSWRPGRGVRTHAVSLVLSNGRRTLKITSRRRLVIRAVHPRARGSVLVAGLGPDNAAGPVARRALPRPRAKRRK